MIWLGVDGGGTKTAGCLVDGAGTVLAEATGPRSYAFSDGFDAVSEVLGDLIGALCNEAGITTAAVDHAFVGLPGHGEVGADLARLDALPAPLLGHDRYTCGNDMVCGWAGSLGGADGVNVVAGTGSIAYGERAGRGVRVGGWGEVFGDEGSAYWIGVEGLRLAARMSDGRAERGPWLDLLTAHLGLTVELDLVDLVLNRWRGDRAAVAGLARQVSLAATRGDRAAAGILAAAAEQLALLVTTARRRAAWPDAEPMPVSWSGGVFASSPVRGAFRAALTGASHPYEVREPLLAPVRGAALQAARLAGHPLPGDAVARLAGHRTVGPLA